MHIQLESSCKIKLVVLLYYISTQCDFCAGREVEGLSSRSAKKVGEKGGEKEREGREAGGLFVLTGS